MGRASPIASALWGVEGSGISPTMLSSLRAQVAGASGIGSPCRCATTAIYIAYKVDPAVEVFTRLLRSFHRWIFDPVHVWEQLRAVWRKVYKHVVVDGQAMFQRVVGPMGAVIASIASLGWVPSTLEGWYDHDGVYRQLKRGSVEPLLVSVLS